MKEAAIDIFKKCIIDSLGLKTYNEQITKIADILNELDYRDVDLPAKATADLVVEIIEDKSVFRTVSQEDKSVFRTVSQNEVSLGYRPKNSGGLSLGKWKWKSTTDKILLLQAIEKRKKNGITWTEMKKELGVDARSFIYNIIRARVYATKIEMSMAHKIWKNLIRQEE